MDSNQTDLPDSTYPAFLSDRYQSITKIGEGGMGSVYRAHDKHLDKDVVIKVIKSESNYEKHAVQFQREAKALSKLKHDNLVTCLDFGAGEGELLYMVLDYIEGETLAERIEKESRLSIELTKRILIQICKGMKHAHNNKVLHRDLKPENILLDESEDNQLKVKIIDFGIAKQEDREGADTGIGIIKGSPFYIAPEIINGGAASPSSDIYSLGCLMFKCLTGKVPFEGENTFNTFEKHLNDPIPKVSAIHDECPDELDDLITRCLSKSPSDRINSISSILEHLETPLESLKLPGLDEVLTENVEASKTSALSIAVISLTASVVIFVLYIGLSGFFNTNPEAEKKTSIQEEKANPACFMKTQSLSRDVWKADPTSPVDDEDLAKLIAGAKPRNLDFTYCAITGVGLKGYEKRWKIKYIAAPNSEINDEGVKYICANKHLEYLDLSDTKITDACLPYFEQLPNLYHVEFSYNKGITQDGIINFLKKHPPNLVSVKFKNLGLDSKSVPYIVAFNPEQLEIAGNDFNDDDLIEIAKIPRLKNIDISFCQGITDRSFKVLADKPGLKEIECVGLNGVSKSLILKYKKIFEAQGKTFHIKSTNQRFLPE